MKRRAFSSMHGVGIGVALAALVVVTAFPLSAFGADRVVLAEDFTNVG